MSDAYQIREGLDQMDLARVHAWLTTTYWSPGVSRDVVERAAFHSSLLVGAFYGEEQIGYCRIVSDKATFAWVCDVFVAEEHRGQGLARRMVGYALDHPEHQGLRRWLLATADAHGVYAKLGFEPLQQADRWMVKGKPIPTNKESLPRAEGS